MTYPSDTLIGVAASLGAALLLSGGMVLQALDARQVADQHGLRLSLLGKLIQRPRWLAGTVIGYLALPLQVVALRHAPLVLVQPVHACGLLLALTAGARVLHERSSSFALAGTGVIVGGLAMVAWGAPTGTDRAVNELTLASCTALLTLLAFAPYVSRAGRNRVALMLCAGLGFAAANMAVKGFSDDLVQHGLIAAAYLSAAAVASTAGLLSQMTAFQRHAAVQVVPVTFAVPNFLPVALAAFVLHERWASAPLAGAAFALGALLLLAGTVTVARTRAVASVVRSAAG